MADPPPAYEDVNVESKQAETKGSQQTSSSGPISSNFSFIMTPSGMLLIINWVLLLLAWTICAGWKDAVHDDLAKEFGSGRSGFFLFTTVTPWLFFIVLFVILLLGLHKRLTFINFPLTMVVNCGIWALFILISSSVLAGGIGDYEDKYARIFDTKEDSLKAAAAFGFFSMIGLIAQGVMHFLEFRKQ